MNDCDPPDAGAAKYRKPRASKGNLTWPFSNSKSLVWRRSPKLERLWSVGAWERRSM